MTKDAIKAYFKKRNQELLAAQKAKYTPEQISELRRKAQKASVKARLKNKEQDEIQS